VKRITIDPVTRIEGHGRVEVFLDDSGEVADAYFVVPELRGFEQLCIGRPVEELPVLTSRVCGLCPEAHHMASAKALDVLFGVEPTTAARAIRELMYSAFVISNHATHFFALAGPDLLMSNDSADADHSVFGVLRQLGPDFARRVLANRVHNHEMIKMLGGRRIHPVAAVPGGWSRRVTEEMRERAIEVGQENLRFALDCLELYQEDVFRRRDHFDLVTSADLSQPTLSMGTVNASDQLEFYDGTLRMIDADGTEICRFPPSDYERHIDEHIEPWTYVKLPYLKKAGWRGLNSGSSSGIFTVGPLARLNVASGLATPLADRAMITMYETLGGWPGNQRRRPIHHRLANHWARLVEQLHVAERMVELASAPELTDDNVRPPVPDRPVVNEAVGSVEAPRGTLLHHYRVDDDGIVTGVNLIVATTHNHAAIALSVTAVARALINGRTGVPRNALDRIEIAIRAYDPCLACATHTHPGDMPLEVVIRDSTGAQIDVVRR